MHSDWCVLCGMSPMPITVELPDGCLAHPGCADDPVFAEMLALHEPMCQRCLTTLVGPHEGDLWCPACTSLTSDEEPPA